MSTFFTEAGFSVAAVSGLRCSSATSIAEVHPPELRRVVDELDDDSVDAIVQVGTNLSFVQQAAELEAELGKPVLAINVATLWHAPLWRMARWNRPSARGKSSPLRRAI